MNAEPGDTPARQPLVLVVEDEPQLVRFLRATLPPHGYQMVGRGDRRTGRSSRPRRRTPDLVLLDLGLPDLDGVEVVRRIREWSAMPIVVVSARGQERDKVEALDAGADDYLTKPFGTERAARPDARGAAPLGRVDESKQAVVEAGDLRDRPGARASSGAVARRSG